MRCGIEAPQTLQNRNVRWTLAMRDEFVWAVNSIGIEKDRSGRRSARLSPDA